MKISAFTIVRNAITLQYPVVESILSILPIVNEYVVLVGKSEDGTLDLIKGIGSEKIRIIENEWRDDFQNGNFFGHLTNLAMNECKGDWAFSLQADECIHEKDLPKLLRLIEDCNKNHAVKSICLRYIHFYGDYRTYYPYWHRKACRILRNNGEVVCIGDGVAFALRKSPETRILKGPREHFVKSGVRIYHYSSVKDPSKMVEKANLMRFHYLGQVDKPISKFHYDLKAVKRFTGSHPKVMEKRIAEFKSPLPPYRSRWLNPDFYRFLLTHGYKG